MPKIMCNGQEVNGINNNKDVLDKIAEVEGKVDTNTTDISELKSDVSANSEAIAVIPKMKRQTGEYDCKTDTAQWVRVDVTFDTPYKENPLVIINWWHSLHNESLVLSGISKTGFTYWAYCDGNTAQAWLTLWQAYGEVE